MDGTDRDENIMKEGVLSVSVEKCWFRVRAMCSHFVKLTYYSVFRIVILDNQVTKVTKSAAASNSPRVAPKAL